MGKGIETSAPSNEKRSPATTNTDNVDRPYYLAPFLRGSRVEVRSRGNRCPRPRHRHLQRRELRVVRFARLGLLVLAHHLVLVPSRRGEQGRRRWRERCC